jgi:hypothetical protein
MAEQQNGFRIIFSPHLIALFSFFLLFLKPSFSGVWHELCINWLNKIGCYPWVYFTPESRKSAKAKGAFSGAIGKRACAG